MVASSNTADPKHSSIGYRLWQSFILVSLALWSLGIVLTIQQNMLLGGFIGILGSCAYCIWLAKDLHINQRKMLILWILFQFLAPLLPIGLSAFVEVLGGKTPDLLALVTGTGAYFYMTYLAIASISVLLESLTKSVGENFPVIILSFNCLLALLAAMVTGTLLADASTPNANVLLSRLLIIILLAIFLLPANFAARIWSL